MIKKEKIVIFKEIYTKSDSKKKKCTEMNLIMFS